MRKLKVVEISDAIGPEEHKKRKYLKQSDVPSCSIDEALKVAAAIRDDYGSKPTPPLKVAKSLNLTPSASSFQMATGASIAYGLTSGGYNAAHISITDLGSRVLRADRGQDAMQARREAFLKPNAVRKFLEHYNGSPLPRPDIAHNFLEELGVPNAKSAAVFEFIKEGANKVGFLQEISGKNYVHIEMDAEIDTLPKNHEAQENGLEEVTTASSGPRGELIPTTSTPCVNKRVFITHGKNKEFLEPIKKLLGFGELEPLVSVEKTSVSQPVPEKVLGEMRSCGAAIIHVDAELKLIDSNAKEHVVLNPNVLIEIGAAMALYGRRFILLVREGVNLPSNLQGLFEVRYSGEMLDGNATIRLLEAINDIKNHPGPERPSPA